MMPRVFVGDTAAEAVDQVRREMGPEAVVLNVRKLPPEGLARLWQKPRIEVTAALHNQAPKSEAPAEALAELRSELAAIKQSLTRNHPLLCHGRPLPPLKKILRMRPSQIHGGPISALRKCSSAVACCRPMFIGCWTRRESGLNALVIIRRQRNWPRCGRP